MQKWFWNPLARSIFVFAFIGMSAAESTTAATVANSDYCQSGRQIRRFTTWIVQKIPQPQPGIPLDQTLERQERWVHQAREEIHRTLKTNPPPDLERIMHDYTFLLSEKIKEDWAFKDLPETSGITMAIKYQKYLWNLYLEKMTAVKEAAAEDPYLLKFEVDLDLELYCRYRQRVQDLLVSCLHC